MHTFPIRDAFRRYEKVSCKSRLSQDEGGSFQAAERESISTSQRFTRCYERFIWSGFDAPERTCASLRRVHLEENSTMHFENFEIETNAETFFTTKSLTLEKRKHDEWMGYYHKCSSG